MTAGHETSVVIQGPVHGATADPPENQLTRRVVASVRQHMPGAEVIVSTWKGSPTSQLGADIVVLSDDPGAVALADDGPLGLLTNNLNRQLVSTQRGLDATTRRYAVKLRSDALLVKPIDLETITKDRPQGPHRVFQGRVAVLNLYTRHPLKRPVLFHLSDLFHAGFKDDLQLLWRLPLVPEPGFTRTIDPDNPPSVNVYPHCQYLFRAAPEQYLGESLCRLLDPSVRLSHFSDARIRWLELWLATLASNFQILTPEEAGVRFPDRLAKDARSWDLFQPEDLGPLSEWSASPAPILTRARTALAFVRLRRAYRKAGTLSRAVSRLAAMIR